jgi:hypothetical protein
MSIAVDKKNGIQIMKKAAQTRNTKDVNSLFISFYLCTWVVIIAIIVSAEFWHWFVFPVWACGVLIGIDAVDWARRRTSVLDPVGIIGLLGFHFFFLAPLLHVHWDYWMRYVTPPEEWRFWLGWMAVLNFLGLLVYRFVRSRWKPVVVRSQWRIDDKRFPALLLFFLLFTGILQVWVYAQYGGIAGYIQVYESRSSLPAFADMGWIFLLSESFPILFLFGYAYYARCTGKLKSWKAVLLFLILFFVLRLFFGGLRGSRSNTIWALFWAVGVIHLWVRPISRKFVYATIPALVLLMYIGGLYKGVGADVVDALDSPVMISQLGEETGREIESTLLADLARSDVQALLLSRIIDQSTSYELALGRTYLGALGILVPRSWWPDRPPHKVKEGTEIMYGPYAYDSGWRSSRVYGLSGEVMLNFGPWLVPIAFAILGLVVSAVGSFMSRLDISDSRLLLVPLAINLCFVVLVGDSDNILFFTIKNGALPFIFVLAISYKMQRESVVHA